MMIACLLFTKRQKENETQTVLWMVQSLYQIESDCKGEPAAREN